MLSNSSICVVMTVWWDLTRSLNWFCVNEEFVFVFFEFSETWSDNWNELVIRLIMNRTTSRNWFGDWTFGKLLLISYQHQYCYVNPSNAPLCQSISIVTPVHRHHSPIHWYSYAVASRQWYANASRQRYAVASHYKHNI